MQEKKILQHHGRGPPYFVGNLVYQTKPILELGLEFD